MAQRRAIAHSRSCMNDLARKRCSHCARVLSTVTLDHAREFATPWAAVVCVCCDAVPGADAVLRAPDYWD